MSGWLYDNNTKAYRKIAFHVRRFEKENIAGVEFETWSFLKIKDCFLNSTNRILIRIIWQDQANGMEYTAFLVLRLTNVQ